MSASFLTFLKVLNIHNMDEATRSLIPLISRPNRSLILYTRLEKDVAAIDESHRCRIVWIKDQISTILPHIRNSCESLPFDNLNKAQESLGLLNNIGFDVKNLVSILKHYLTWELQLTEDMNQMGILPVEVPSIVSCFDEIRKINRHFAEKVSTLEYRMSTSLETKRRNAIEHDTLVSSKMTPMVRVLSLKMSNVSSTVLDRFTSDGAVLSEPTTRKACFKCLQKSLILEARKAQLNGEKFDIKVYLA